MKRTADQLLTLVQQLCIMDMAYLGENDTVRKTFLYDYLSLAMHALVKSANQMTLSAPVTISADGPTDFGVTDMYQPVRLIDTVNKTEVRQSNSFTFPNGWFWESSGQPVYVSGLRGTFTLHYVKYPAWITAGSQTPEFPPSGYMALIYECAALIKQSKNFYEESNAMKDQARSSYMTIEDASKKRG